MTTTKSDERQRDGTLAECHDCGRAVSGQFCHHCGASVGSTFSGDGLSQAGQSAGTNLAAALNEGLNGAMATLPPRLMTASSTYPVQVTFEPAVHANRVWAIPFVGWFVKSLMLIPHYLGLAAVGVAVSFLQLVLWIPVLTSGQYPEWGYSLVTGTIRWSVRVMAYQFGLTDQYPPFGPGNEGEVVYPVRVTFQPQSRYNRGFAIPVVGYFIKYVLLIPHSILIAVLGFVVGLLQLVLWVPVLFTGQYPSWGYDLCGGYIRWTTRSYAYLLGLTDQYPPFQMG